MDYISERERKIREKGAYFAEFFGSFFINFALHSLDRIKDAAYIPYVIGTTFCLAVFASHKLSGAHLNAAVTLAHWLKNRDQEYKRYIYYVVAQVLGGLFAGFMMPFLKFDLILPDHTHDATVSEALSTQIFFTFFLCLVHLYINDPFQPRFDPVMISMVIGAVYLLISMTLGPATGGIVNPSIGLSIGLSRMIFTDESSKLLPLWIIAPFVGALGSGWFYGKFLQREDSKKFKWLRSPECN